MRLENLPFGCYPGLCLLKDLGYGGGSMPDQSKPEKLLPDWGQFREAMQVFSQDLSIVSHAGETTVPPFGEPKDYGQYSLTQIPEDMGEAQFRADMERVDKVLITCMDKRVARSAWIKEGGEKGGVFILAIGGGVVQDGIRQQAMEIIARYLGQFGNINQVVAAGHEHICGAAKYFLGQRGLAHEKGVCGLINKEPGCQEEKEIMDQLIAYGAKVWISVFGQDRVVAKNAVVSEQGRDVEMSEINLDSIEPMSVKQLAEIYQ